MIEKIYNCQTCRNYAKSIAGEEHEEVFSLAIEKIIKKNDYNFENYKSYFYTVLKSVYLNKISKERFVELDNNITEETEENLYKLALDRFLQKQTDEIDIKFYQDIIYLSLENSQSSLAKKLGMTETNLNIYLKQAYELIRLEFSIL